MHRLSFLLSVIPVALAAQGPVAPPTREVSLAFRGLVADSAFACGTRYPGVGLGRSEVWGTEFRFYVHAVRLLKADGTEVPVELTQDGLWQHRDVALVDFEDATGQCANGTPETNAVVRGTVPEGAYTGVRFVLGVPADRNHLELAAQPSPLSLSRLYWSWTGGYKYMRLDMRSAHPDSAGVSVPWVLHLGAAQCAKADSLGRGAGDCKLGNRAEVTLRDFDPTRDAIGFDIAALYAGVDVAKNTPKTASGCMSAPDDPDCGPIFAALGLSHPAAPTQAVAPAFRVVRRSPP